MPKLSSANVAKLQSISKRFKDPAPVTAATPIAAGAVNEAMRVSLEKIAKVAVPGSYIHRVAVHGLAGQVFIPKGDQDGEA